MEWYYVILTKRMTHSKKPNILHVNIQYPQNLFGTVFQIRYHKW